jgi:hypothetical protein
MGHQDAQSLLKTKKEQKRDEMAGHGMMIIGLMKT